ncbi:hypothetical protein NQ317_017376 [Molorchus minor]|uniref:Uncharacterized protein n=1 Tax=Molorchus minor TaxID=1323400 RepID=A0ABQ9JDB0_9CUCU|nr:hypothetical protein NQ317_017376 [Molorchus minor]
MCHIVRDLPTAILCKWSLLEGEAQQAGDDFDDYFSKILYQSRFRNLRYIDYAERLVKKIMPRYTDLGYYHWRAEINVNDSLNYFVTYDDQEECLLYQNNFDRKKINPAPGQIRESILLKKEDLLRKCMKS